MFSGLQRDSNPWPLRLRCSDLSGFTEKNGIQFDPSGFTEKCFRGFNEIRSMNFPSVLETLWKANIPIWFIFSFFITGVKTEIISKLNLVGTLCLGRHFVPAHTSLGMCHSSTRIAGVCRDLIEFNRCRKSTDGNTVNITFRSN